MMFVIEVGKRLNLVVCAMVDKRLNTGIEDRSRTFIYTLVCWSAAN